MNLKKIKAIVFDFDGVFTNNRVIVSEDGKESVICNRSDGIGLEMLRSLGIPMTIISTEKNPVVAQRATKLEFQQCAPEWLLSNQPNHCNGKTG